ncbi:hypothetical protein [Actinoplanes sp. NPDC023714]|uniref:hypothetical protein n=1 Tax=Actinoplanes sp. NPDC023714 TaxID=3154322 RepID=UPI003404C1E3
MAGHRETIRRRLAGEVVGGSVGILLSGGPFDGRIRIVELDRDQAPPPRFRARGGAAGRTWHTYEAVRSPAAAAGWVYAHVGPSE